ncbi:unnamed protein product [Clonostachys rhizophaga]|uniref:Uncharacterized protein n=1 Tax=Clonostachys rhizophaga TaxID=160324 RepID=A0A9N9VQS0_9HYPO|nr:unnamed protein product [Clonostachys rhizophaga]
MSASIVIATAKTINNALLHESAINKVRGHVNTDDHDGRSLQILIMIEDQDNQKEAVSSLNADVELWFVTRIKP